MTEPCVWKLICTNCQISCHGQQRCNSQVECSDCITTTGCTCDGIDHLPCCIKDVTEPCVWKLIGTNCKISCNSQQRSNSQIKCPNRITTTGCTCNSVRDYSCASKHMAKPGVWKVIGTNCKVSCNSQ